MTQFISSSSGAYEKKTFILKTNKSDIIEGFTSGIKIFH